MNRRTVLTWAVRGFGLLFAGMVALPALVSGAFPLIQHRRRVPRWQPLGPVEEFSVGETVRMAVPVSREDWSEALRAKSVYVWRPHEPEWVVFSRNCTDLSCPVVFDQGAGCFFCPCHGGIFAQDGQPMAGPPSRPLYRYASRVRDGVLEIDLNSLPLMT